MQKLTFKISFYCLLLLAGLTSACNKERRITTNEISVDSTKLESGSIITDLQSGVYAIDSTNVLPEYDSSLRDEYNYVREMIENRSSFKLKSEWDNGNDSPSNGIWLEYSSDTTRGYYAISTLEGHISIYGSSRESIKEGILQFEKLFIQSGDQPRQDNWNLPLIMIEHREN